MKLLIFYLETCWIKIITKNCIVACSSFHWKKVMSKVWSYLWSKIPKTFSFSSLVHFSGQPQIQFYINQLYSNQEDANESESFIVWRHCQRTRSSMFRATFVPSSRSSPSTDFWDLPTAKVKLRSKYLLYREDTALARSDWFLWTNSLWFFKP